MIVVSEDLVRGSRIQHRQLVDAAKNVFELSNDNWFAPFRLETFQPFLQGLVNRAGQRFAGLRRKLPSEPLNIQALYTHRHT